MNLPADRRTTSPGNSPSTLAGAAQRELAKVHIRWMIRRDLPEVVAIEEDSFEFPWSEGDFARLLGGGTIIGLIAEGEQGRVVGYCVYDLQKTAIELRNLAVDASARRRGVGRQLVDKLKSKLNPARRRQLYCLIQDHNLVGQLFLARQGFVADGVLRGHFDDLPDWELARDAYVMHFRHDRETIRR